MDAMSDRTPGSARSVHATHRHIRTPDSISDRRGPGLNWRLAIEFLKIGGKTDQQAAEYLAMTDGANPLIGTGQNLPNSDGSHDCRTGAGCYAILPLGQDVQAPLYPQPELLSRITYSLNVSRPTPLFYFKSSQMGVLPGS